MSALPNTAAPVDIVPVSGLLAFMEFCRVPRLLYAGMKGFSPSLDAERWTLYGHKLNPHYKLVRSQAFLAKRDGRTVGRIEAQIYKDMVPHEASPAQFGSLDAIDDAGVVAALLRAAEDWLSAQGANVVHGPFSPSINSECGLLVDGFDAKPMVFMPWHPPYLGGHVEAAGYAKARDLVSYKYLVSDRDRTAEPVMMNRKEWKERLRYRPLDLKNLESEVRLMVDLFNDGWAENWGFVPMTYDELKSVADSLKFIMEEDQGFVTEIDGEPVAFGIMVPNLHEIVADMNGRLGLTGAPKLIGRMRKRDFRSLRLALFGVKKSLHKSAKGGIVILTMIEKMRLLSRTTRAEQLEFGWVLENNMGMRKPIEMAGSVVDKIHRIYERRLAAAPGA